MIASLLLLVFSIRKHPKIKDGSNFVNVDDSLDIRICMCLKGVCAIYLMLGHYNMRIPFQGINVILKPVQPGAILVNGLFFFISGYGLMISSITKNNYLSFISYIKRLINVGIVAYLSYLFSFPLGGSSGTMGFIRHLFLFNLFRWFHFNDPTWFLIELVFLYTLFWAIYSRVTSRVADTILVTSILLWYIVAVLTGRGVVWYGSTLCFVLGIFVARTSSKSDTKEGYNRLFYWTLLTLVLLACYMMCMLYNRFETSIVWGAFLCNTAAALFCTFVYMFLQKFRIYSCVLEYLGKISFEVYLNHIYMIEWNVGKVPDSTAIWVSILLTLIVATVLHMIAMFFKRVCGI